MSRHNVRFAPYRVQCRSQMQYFNAADNISFKTWRDEYVKDSRHSQQEDLPSSQLPKLDCQLIPSQKQLFAVIDTCSLIKHSQEFTNFVTGLRRSYRGLSCPVRFIIPIEVVEELDKCNRPSKKRNSKQNERENGAVENQAAFNYPEVGDILDRRHPPRSFMRVIEEELRIFQIILPDFDPGHSIKLPTGNLSGANDNSILGSCRRAQIFIESRRHHPETKVILITEDNLFKTKATSFGLPSFRWKEFFAKYRNFGKKNCSETPIIPNAPITAVATAVESGPESEFDGPAPNWGPPPSTTALPPWLTRQETVTIKEPPPSPTPKLKVERRNSQELTPLPPFSSSQESVKAVDNMIEIDVRPKNAENRSALGKILPTKERPAGQSSSASNMRPTSMRINKLRNYRSSINSRLFGTLLGNPSNCSSQDEVSIVKEVITVE